jgi:hypothetical protein
VSPQFILFAFRLVSTVLEIFALMCDPQMRTTSSKNASQLLDVPFFPRVCLIRFPVFAGCQPAEIVNSLPHASLLMTDISTALDRLLHIVFYAT